MKTIFYFKGFDKRGCLLFQRFLTAASYFFTLLGYDLNSLRKEARRLKQTLVDNHVNTHFIDESNFRVISKMLEILILDKRRRLVDYLLQQEEFVKCCWDREYEKYKQSQLESLNRRDSGLGNRSLLHKYYTFI